MAPGERPSSEVDAVADELESRLTADPWTPVPTVAPATEVADFALTLSGKRTQARRGGRVGRLIASFALAACLALASVAAACDKPNASSEEAAEAISQLPTAGPAEGAVSAKPRAGPAAFYDLVLVTAGTTEQPWAVLLPKGGGTAPILVDSVGSELDTVGGVYKLPSQPVTVGTRDGVSQFLDPLVPAEQTDSVDVGQRTSAAQSWAEDERYLAATRAIAGTPSVLDAAYNAEAAAAAGGTHTYLNGVVLRTEPDKPVLQVIDKALLESGRPTRAEDIVYVAIRSAEQSLYEPGAVVNLRDVVIDKQQTDVNGEPLTVYVANAALEGARVEPTGKVDLQSLLAPRLQRVNEDLAAQAQAADPGQAAAASPAGTQTPVVIQQTIINNNNNRGSHIGDFLIYAWLFNNSFYRGPSTIINNPGSRPGGDLYYSAPPTTSGTSPTTTAAQQAATRTSTVQASRAAVSGTSGGTGGGVAATNKSAADSTARVSAATSKATSVASTVSSSSSGKSITSVPKSSSTTSSRSAGSVSSGSRGSSVSSSSGSSSGFGGKGVGSSSSS